MRFGVCAMDKFDVVKKAGYDFVEVCLSVISQMSENDFLDFKSRLEKTGLKAEAANGFLPADIKIIGNEANIEKFSDYADFALKRFSLIGGKTAVFGSGFSRKIPDGFSKDEAYAQFCNSLKLCGDIAEKYGITIVIEPLNKDETDLINTVAEGLKLCDDVNHPNVLCLADFFHMYKSGEDLTAIENAGRKLSHVHLARQNDDRKMPKDDKDLNDCKKFAAALKKCGYDNRISLEGIFDADFQADILNTKAFLEVFN